MEEKARIKKQNCKKGFKKNEHAFSMDGVQRPRGWADAQHRSMHVEMGWGQACGWLFGNVGRLFLCGGCENCIAARGGCGGVTLLRCCCCMKTAKSAWGLHESALAWTGDSSMESYCVIQWQACTCYVDYPCLSGGCSSSNSKSDNKQMRGVIVLTIGLLAVSTQPADGAGSQRGQRKICMGNGHCLACQALWCKAAKHKAYKLYTWFNFLVTAVQRKIAYISSGWRI